MVENVSQAGLKIIVETSDFLSEMISESLDSPPASPKSDKKTTKSTSNSKTHDCFKVAQPTSDIKLAKEAKNNLTEHSPSLIEGKVKNSHKEKKSTPPKEKDEKDEDGDDNKTQEKSKNKKKKKQSHQEERSRNKSSSNGTKTSNKIGVKCSKETSKDSSRSKRADTSKRRTKDRRDRRRKERKRYEEVVIDNILINAFKTWEDLQDEINERISANLRANNHRATDADQQGQWGSTSKVEREHRHSSASPPTPGDRQASSASTEHRSNESTKITCQSQNIESDKSNKPDTIPSPQQGSHYKVKLDPQLQDGIPSQRATTSPSGDYAMSARIERNTSLPAAKSCDQISGLDGHPKLDSSIQQERRDHDRHKSTKNRHHQTAFVLPLAGGQPPSQSRANSSDQHMHPSYLQHLRHQTNPPPTSFGSSMGAASNQYLSQYFNSNAYTQHLRDTHLHHQQHQQQPPPPLPQMQPPYGLPPLGQSFLPPPPAPAPPPPPQSHMLASSSLMNSYASPYTITDTIISRQTIIPSSMAMASGRYNNFPHSLAPPPPPPPSMASLEQAALMRQAPHYVPSPTERSFMEFARSYAASANNMSSLLNQTASTNLPGGGLDLGPGFNPSFDRFGMESRAAAAAAAFAASKAYSGSHYTDPMSRFGMPMAGQHPGHAGPATPFYPQHHFFR